MSQSLCILTFALVPHVYVNHEGVADLLSRWKPRMMSGNVVSSFGVDRYVRAHHILSKRRADVYGLARVNEDEMHLFVFTRDNSTVVLQVVLWDVQNTCKVTAFRDMRNWYKQQSRTALFESRLDQREETDLFDISAFPP